MKVPNIACRACAINNKIIRGSNSVTTFLFRSLDSSKELKIKAIPIIAGIPTESVSYTHLTLPTNSLV